MKRWLIWIRRYCKDWPLFISMMVGFFNIEVATPFILKGILGLGGEKLGISAGIWASIELCWWNYFSGWLYKHKIRKLHAVNEVINMREAVKEFDWRTFLLPKRSDPYLVVKIKDFIRKHSIDNFDPDNYKDDRFFINLIRALRSFGYLFTCSLIFVMGFLPLCWIFALMVCRLFRWKLAYLALFISNFFKNYLLASIYEKIGFWWWVALFLLSVIIVSYVLKRIVNNIKQMNENHR